MHDERTDMRLMRRIAVLVGVVAAVKWLYDKYVAPARQPMQATSTMRSSAHVGYDTPTGTDPNAKYTEPGYQDKSFGQAVDQDQQLVEELVREADGDLDEAAARFAHESAGAPVLERQEQERRSG